ncbi:MAG: phage holin family protein [Lachnospiraceae bacterium]|nr:phage holin family protein [Lachnospiraceae bacterium]
MRIFLLMVQSIIGVVLGGWDGLLSALILFMVVEYLTQILVAILNKKLSSEIGFCGIAKKVSIIILVMIGNVIDVLIIQNGSVIRTAVIFFYLSNEGIVILENVALLGLPIPQKLKDILEQLKDGRK